ncbi:MAG: acyl-CoA dehydrogenase family protein [Sphingomonas sp.]|uniref:acyl-CoA dehydrogenase family protein n=1 Tax=Sphingomonas sp. TaxID=28214 RepID=UPI003F81C96C
MNFDYSDEQKFLKEEARRFLAARCPMEVTRKVLDDDGMPFDRELWRAVAEMGWTGVAIPERWGGNGLSYVELCAIAEELGRAVAPIPFASTVYIFAEAILAIGTDEQRDAYLPGVARGDIIGCLATSEGPGYTAESAAVYVVEGRLFGEKSPVTDGDVATHAIVLAQDEKGVGLFVANLADEGVTREPLRTLDPTRSAAQIIFDGLKCERLGAAGGGGALLSSILDRAAALLAFEQIGGADRCLESAVRYAKERFAFGRQIGSYQAIKHKLADVYVRIELARSNAYYGAWALDADAPELPEAAAAARIAGTQAYDVAAKENLHVHGGMGFTWEVDCHLHVRRARQLALVLGGPPVWSDRLLRRLDPRRAH